MAATGGVIGCCCADGSADTDERACKTNPITTTRRTSPDCRSRRLALSRMHPPRPKTLEPEPEHLNHNAHEDHKGILNPNLHYAASNPTRDVKGFATASFPSTRVSGKAGSGRGAAPSTTRPPSFGSNFEK